MTIVALEVQVHAFSEALLAQQRVVQPDNLSTLLVHSHRIEVVHLDVAIGADGVGHGACIFWELRHTESHHVFDALHRPAVQVRGELLVAEHSEAFLQGQLEPVPAGHPVTGVVVEVLVANDAFNAAVVQISGSLWAGQHQPGVEDVEGLVLHCSHVEIIDRHDVEQVQVVLQAKSLLIPLHGLHQGLQGVVHLAKVVLLHKDAQGHVLAGHGLEHPFLHGQLAGHQGKQVARLGEWVLPQRKMPASLKIALGLQVAVAQ
mmetsp:Transcript_25641/g.69587  ORF Transcript_25641/g.69587 Transcript_25641/m.69587 type:complete len:260 (+) Transcript_25641:1878-2657(+)